MRILGIDPGLAIVGLGVVDALSPYDLRVHEWLTLRTEAGLTLPQRLRIIHDDLLSYIREVHPDTAVVERLFFATNEKTAIDVAQARGIILLTLEECAIPHIAPTPLQLKSVITGNGKADKAQVQDMIMRTLKLTELPQPDDAADALGLAIYGALQAFQPTWK